MLYLGFGTYRTLSKMHLTQHSVTESIRYTVLLPKTLTLERSPVPTSNGLTFPTLKNSGLLKPKSLLPRRSTRREEEGMWLPEIFGHQLHLHCHSPFSRLFPIVMVFGEGILSGTSLPDAHLCYNKCKLELSYYHEYMLEC